MTAPHSAAPPAFAFVGQDAMGGAALRSLVLAGLPPTAVVTRPATSRINDVESVVSDLAPAIPLHRVCQEDFASISGHLVSAAVDVVVCCAWGALVPGECIESLRYGWINCHPSFLPAWRGGNPIAWQLLSSARTLGYTVHRMDHRFDAGEILEQGTILRSRNMDGTQARLALGEALGDAASTVLRAGAFRSPPPHGLREMSAAESICPPLGIVPLLDPPALSVAQARRAVLAFSPRPGVAIAGLPDRYVAAGTDWPAEFEDVQCRDGALRVQRCNDHG